VGLAATYGRKTPGVGVGGWGVSSALHCGVAVVRT